MLTVHHTRRTLLKGLSLGAGATVLGPTLNRLVREAHGAPSAARRVIFVLSGNGYNVSTCPEDLLGPDGFRPGGRHGTPQLLDMPCKKPPRPLSGFEPFVDRMLIIDDTSVGLGAGHYQDSTSMACEAQLNEFVPGGKTIDRFIAERIGQDTAVPLLTLGTGDRGSEQYVRAFSALGPGQPITFSANPFQISRTLFGGGGADSRDRFILDDLREDVARASMRLAGPEKAKFDQFLGSVETIGRRMQLLGAARAVASCKAPDVDPMVNMQHPETRIEILAELGTAALICGMTRVLSLSMFSGEEFSPVYTRLGYTMSMHSLGHGAKDPKHPTGEEDVRIFQSQVIAAMLKKLQAMPEGGGTMYDNTVLVYHNDNGNSHHSRPQNPWFLALVGNAGGALRATGRYVRYPGRSNSAHRQLCDVWTTLCNAVGVNVPHFNPNTPQDKRGVIDYLLTSKA